MVFVCDVQPIINNHCVLQFVVIIQTINLLSGFAYIDKV